MNRMQSAAFAFGIVLAHIVAVQATPGAEFTHLQWAMHELNIHTVLVVSGQDLDEKPLWSADSRFLAVNTQGKWRKIDISEFKELKAAKWHSIVIGVIAPAPAQMPVSADQVKAWDRNPKNDPRKALLKSGITIELPEERLSTGLVLSRDGKRHQVWTSGMENCYQPVVSPDDRFVAYICELNGVFVTDLQAALDPSPKDIANNAPAK